VSMAWHLDQSVDFWTGNLATVSHVVTQDQLQPGDILLSSSHVVLFAGWTDSSHTSFDMYEESHPGVPTHLTIGASYASYANSGFTPYSYDEIEAGGPAGSSGGSTSGGAASSTAQGGSTSGPPVMQASVTVYSPLLALNAVPKVLPAPPPIAYTDGGGTMVYPGQGSTSQSAAGSGPGSGGSALSAETTADEIQANKAARRSDPLEVGSAAALLAACWRGLRRSLYRPGLGKPLASAAPLHPAALQVEHAGAPLTASTHGTAGAGREEPDA
jgi:hypothetical protein